MYHRRGGLSHPSPSPCVVEPVPENVHEQSSDDADLDEDGPHSDDGPLLPDGRKQFQRNPYTGALMIHPSMSREITATFKRIRNITGFNWKLTPQEIKDAYFQEFQKAYAWPDSWEHDVHKLWKNRAAKRFSGFISALKKMKNENVGRQGYVLEEMCNGLVETLE
ncbi:uncharacterized protein LOC121772118 [Salvia splendens]|uniref:uncharacterized protein LOC121772118 n=1 Tax=Salvia splendens TaxID=180675 RepID=UPI001C25619B|nr:uncharacterized protein LOC121772118 [Salvia splendens]